MVIIFVSFLVLLTAETFSIALGVAVLRAQERKRVRGYLAQLDERPSPIKAPLNERAARSAGALGGFLSRFTFARQL